MDIALQGKYSKGELRQALTMGFGRWFKILGTGTLVLAALFLVVVLLIAFPLGASGMIGMLSNTLPCLLGLCLFGGMMLASPLLSARKMAKSPLFERPVTGSVTDEAVEISSDLTTTRVEWQAFVNYRMAGEVVLLYQSRAAFSILPRGLFASDDDWQRFRQHVRDTLPEK